MLPLFLDIERTLRTHCSLIEHYGGIKGVFLHQDLYEMAAAYLFHIVQNHPFLDGNKRTGAAAAIIFLAMNGIEIEADEDGLVALTLAVAEGQAGKSEIADFFRSKAHPPSPPKAL